MLFYRNTLWVKTLTENKMKLRLKTAEKVYLMMYEIANLVLALHVMIKKL